MDHHSAPHLKLDWNAKLVRSFLHNSRFVILLLVVSVVGGLFALSTLRREGFPVVSPKIVLVQTVYPGATAGEVEKQVTSVLEDAVQDVRGLKSTSSTSAGSFSNIVVALDESVTLDNALQDVQTKVQAARADLPNDAEQSRVQTFSTSGPAFAIGVTSPSQDLQELQKQADVVIDELSDVEGVKSVTRYSDVEERITVRFRPADLTTFGVSLQTLQLALQGANVNFPVGSLSVDDRQQAVTTVGAFGSLDQMRELLVGVNPANQQPVRLKDVANVTRAFDGEDTIQRFGYRKGDALISANGVLLSLEVSSTADIITTKEALDTHIAEAKADGRLPNDLELVTVFDQAKSTSDQINEIVGGALGNKNNAYLLGGLQLLFLAMLLLVNWRAALIAALSVPISLLFTFGVLQVFSVQLNTIVLFSLILVLGLIVDPAIVMVEAIQRYRDLKYNKDEAIIESGRRYGASLFMAVLTSVIVFVPFGVVSGVFGEIIKFIPLTVIPALFASYMVPIAFLPLFSKWLLKSHPHEGTVKDEETAELTGAARWFMRLNTAILKRTWLQIATLVIGLVLVGASLSLVGSGKVQTVQFSSPNDNTNFTLNATFNPGLTTKDRDLTTKALEAIILAEPGIANFFYFSQDRNSVSLYGEFLPKSERDDGSKTIVKRMQDKLSQAQRVQYALAEEAGVGTPASSFQISTQLYDPDAKVLEVAAKDIGAFLAAQEKVAFVDDGFSNGGEAEIRLVLDRTKVQAAGLSSFEVGQQLRAVLDESRVTKYAGEGGSADVYLVNAGKPADVDTIRNLPLVGRTGQVRTVEDLATVEQASAVGAIQRFDGKRFVNVRARVDGNNNDVFAVQRKLNDYATPEKLASLGIDSNESRGEFDDIAKSFSELFMALVTAIVLTYIVLVIQFKSFSQPVVMLVTVPLAFIGVFPALWAVGTDLGFLELLGVTILVGIVENVAIFLIDYANQLRREGATAKEAIVQATGVRFRPILLTKLVALGGLLPLAIESEFWRGLSVVIIAGIGLSGFLSLMVIPILYTWIENLRDRVHRKKQATI
ncbi:MAG: efflux RND transporter permease subunit [Patescibacteria group bacterium]